MVGSRPTRSDRLLQAVAEFERILIVTHDNPDPDAIAGGWAIQVLIRERLGKPAPLIGGGDIVRAENRHMVKLLEPPIELVQELDAPAGTAAILVDCGVGSNNHLLAKENVRPFAVIDHHLPSGTRRRIVFRDVRPRVAAVASITASYLREQALKPSSRLATAMCYAIRTETRGSQTHHSRLDRSILRWLADFVNPAWLAEIENAPLPHDYFGDLALALQNAFLHADAAFCLLPRATGAEIVGEVADLLIRCDGVRRVFCGAIVGKDLVVSVRTERGGDDAAALLHATLKGLGGGGGHQHRAGGKVPGGELAAWAGSAVPDELRRRWLEACRLDPQRGTRLVPKRELLNSLSR